MNPLLSRLQPYPFERLRQLFAGVTPNPAYRPISLGIGEPQAPDAGVHQGGAGRASLGSGLARYPPTAGDAGAARRRCAGWLRAPLRPAALDPATQVLPVNGSREALFAFAQTVIDPTPRRRAGGLPEPVLPDLRRRGAAGRRASRTSCTSDPARNFAVRLGRRARADVWARTQLLYVCSPGNPTGAVMPLDEWREAVRAVRPPRLRDRLRRVLLRDLLRATSRRWAGSKPRAQLGRADFRSLVVFTSLSKRSNVPGMRSRLRRRRRARCSKQFLLYRTYHGSAMSPIVQARQHRRLERRSARGATTARSTARKFAAGHADARSRCSTCACPTPASTCGPASCRGQRRRAFARDLLRSIQCDGAARQLSRPRRARRQSRRAAACAWRWSPTRAECVEAAQRIVAIRPEHRSNHL